jgi:hypothetical protein
MKLIRRLQCYIIILKSGLLWTNFKLRFWILVNKILGGEK